MLTHSVKHEVYLDQDQVKIAIFEYMHKYGIIEKIEQPDQRITSDAVYLMGSTQDDTICAGINVTTRTDLTGVVQQAGHMWTVPGQLVVPCTSPNVEGMPNFPMHGTTPFPLNNNSSGTAKLNPPTFTSQAERGDVSNQSGPNQGYFPGTKIPFTLTKTPEA